MNKKCENHLAKIQESFIKQVEEKYKHGVKQHGGGLWDKEYLIDFAIDEVLDLYTYLFSLKQQIKKSKVKLGTKKDLDGNN